MPTFTYYVGATFNLFCLFLCWRFPRRKPEVGDLSPEGEHSRRDASRAAAGGLSTGIWLGSSVRRRCLKAAWQPCMRSGAACFFRAANSPGGQASYTLARPSPAFSPRRRSILLSLSWQQQVEARRQRQAAPQRALPPHPLAQLHQPGKASPPPVPGPFKQPIPRLIGCRAALRRCRLWRAVSLAPAGRLMGVRAPSCGMQQSRQRTNSIQAASGAEAACAAALRLIVSGIHLYFASSNKSSSRPRILVHIMVSLPQAVPLMFLSTPVIKLLLD